MNPETNKFEMDELFGITKTGKRGMTTSKLHAQRLGLDPCPRCDTPVAVAVQEHDSLLRGKKIKVFFAVCDCGIISQAFENQSALAKYWNTRKAVEKLRTCSNCGRLSRDELPSHACGDCLHNVHTDRPDRVDMWIPQWT